MPSASSCRLIVVDPRTYFHSHHQRVFEDRTLFQEVHLETDLKDALIVGRKSVPGQRKTSTIFLICGGPYLRLHETIGKIVKSLPDAKIVFLDELVRPGCGVISERLPIHGCCTIHEQPDQLQRCIASVHEGIPFVSPRAATILSVDERQRVVTGRPEYRDLLFYQFSSNEWHCFEHVMNHGPLEELSRKLHLEYRTVYNIKYRMLHRLSLNRFLDLFPLARDWGFIE